MKLPQIIANCEKIVRVLFYPKHFTKEENIIWQAFRTRANEDEVSVVRLDYCDETFCKKHGQSIQNPDNKAKYYGLGVLSAEQIRSVEADVIYTPEHHLYHADITVGYIPIKGDTPPPEIKYKMEQMAEMANFFKDSSPESETWIDGAISYNS